MQNFHQSQTKFPMYKIEYFLLNTNLHGLKYLAKNGKDDHLIVIIFRKIFWTFVILVSLFGLAVTLKNTLQDFYADTILINVETNYLGWENHFPAVSVCLQKGRSTGKLYEYLKRNWDHNYTFPDSVDYMRVLQSYLFVNNIEKLDGNLEICEDLNETCGIDWISVKNYLTPKICEEFLYDVKFMGESIENCSSVFDLHLTEMGYCFIANSFYDGGNQM